MKPVDDRWGFLKSELASRPGRFGNALRIAILTVVVVVVSETFRIPLTAYSAYVVFFASKEDASSTVFMGIVLAVVITLSVFSALGIYMISAGEPGLRLPLMAAIVFAGMFLSRVATLGALGFIIGFLVTISLTLIDVIPTAAAQPSADLVTRAVLWLWIVVMLPAVVLIAGNAVAGRDPIESLRSGVTERLRLAGWILQGVASRRGGAERIDAYVREGTGGLLGSLKAAGLFSDRIRRETPAYRARVARTQRLMELLSDWSALNVSDPDLISAASDCGGKVLSLARSLDPHDSGMPADKAVLPFSGKGEGADERRANLLLAKMTELAGSLFAPGAHPKEGGEKTPVRPLRADAFTNPEYYRYALKTTLAIFIAYITYSLLDWPGIRTCMITCFFVSLGSVGETAHKMVLRLTGALIGGGLGFAVVVFLMPSMTTIAGLSLVIGVAGFLAAWLATSSERLSYAGLQFAMAFFFSTLVGWGPSIALEETRDRIVGIIWGNLIMFFVFTLVWPVSALTSARKALASALEKLSRLSEHEDADEFYLAFDGALAETSRLSSINAFEPEFMRTAGAGRIDMLLVDSVRSLARSVMVLSDPAAEIAGAVTAYKRALGAWLSALGGQLIAGGGAPAPPEIEPFVREIESAAGSSARRVQLQAHADWLRTVDVRAREVGTLANRADPESARIGMGLRSAA